MQFLSYLRTSALAFMCLSIANNFIGLGGRAYPVRHYPIAIRLRDLAFGNIVAMIVDLVNIRATCASALPTHSRSSWGPHNILRHSMCCTYFLRVGTLRVQHSKCHPRHFFTLVATFARRNPLVIRICSAN